MASALEYAARERSMSGSMSHAWIRLTAKRGSNQAFGDPLQADLSPQLSVLFTAFRS